jgi:hypothetical protein
MAAPQKISIQVFEYSSRGEPWTPSLGASLTFALFSCAVVSDSSWAIPQKISIQVFE